MYFQFVLCLVGKIAKIFIRSEGCSDRGKYRGCGRAYIKVNGRDYSTHKRGYNIVVLNAFTGIIKLGFSDYHTLLDMNTSNVNIFRIRIDQIILQRHFSDFESLFQLSTVTVI